MKESTWIPAYIGIGSNLNNPRLQVTGGLDALATLSRTKVISRSALYRSAPLGPQDQPHFVNAVAGVLTRLDAHALLRELKELETKLGKAQPIVHWGPRVIDFDLLVFGSERIATSDLQVPHTGIADRAFVIVPLLDVAPYLDVPGLGPANRLAKRFAAENLERL